MISEIQLGKLSELRPALAAGGTSRVHPYNPDGSKVIKLYTKKQIDRSRIELVAQRLKSSELTCRVATPEAVVMEDDRCVGFLMTKLDPEQYTALDYWTEAPLSSSLPRDRASLKYRISLLKELCTNVSRLHQSGLAIIDLKPSNILINNSDAYPVHLDSDSFCIMDCAGEIIYGGEEITPGYQLPQSIDKDDIIKTLSVEQDMFALSVIIFQVLNNGVHPYQATAITEHKDFSIIQLSKNMEFPYGTKYAGNASPFWLSVHETFPIVLRKAFDRSFLPNGDPLSPDRWQHLFEQILDKSLISDCRECGGTEIKFQDHGCPHCHRSLVYERRATADPIETRSTQQKKMRTLNDASLDNGLISRAATRYDPNPQYGPWWIVWPVIASLFLLLMLIG